MLMLGLLGYLYIAHANQISVVPIHFGVLVYHYRFCIDKSGLAGKQS